MRRCCCCVSVHVGAVFLGLVGLVLAVLELVVLVPYLAPQVDALGFNPIRDYTNQTWFIFEDFLQKQNFSAAQIDDFVAVGQSWTWTAVAAEAACSALYALCCVLLVIGARCRVRGLFVPYLVLQLLVVVVFIGASALLTALLFVVGTPITMGCISLGVALVAAFFLIYFWNAVRLAFVELGNRDYMYSPAPLKPMYNPPMAAASESHAHRPSAPQHFNME